MRLTLAAVKDDARLPLVPIEDTPKPTPAPAIVALLSAWLGLLTLIASIVLLFLPGSTHPRAELEHAQPYSLADRFLPVPIYASAVAIFIAIIVIWQMRKEHRPLPAPMVNQRVQAYVGIALALLAAAVVYIHVALRGPRGSG
jgi:hypothetical protein